MRCDTFLIGTLWGLAFLVYLAEPSEAGAETLLVEGDHNSYSAAVATHYDVDGERVILTLRQGADAAAIAAILRNRLAQVVVDVRGNQLVLSGIDSNTLLQRLTLVHITEDEPPEDPLAELSALVGEVAASHVTERGGSIRAGKSVASALAANPYRSGEGLVGQVLNVVRHDFPNVQLDLKVQEPVQEGKLKGKWQKGAGLRGVVWTSLNLTKKVMQRNLGAYYLMPGDSVWVHVVLSQNGTPVIDFIERRNPGKN